MKIGLIGNQNSGKTTVFNALTGLNNKVGNWPGVTLEKKSGKIKGTNHELVDLPGIYSLSPYTIEETVSCDFIFDDKPDVLINVVDSTELERSLYLTTQLLELDIPVILALNMTDLLEKNGLKLNVDKLSKLLNVNIIQISGVTQNGIDKLISLIDTVSIKSSVKIYSDDIEKCLSSLEQNVKHSRFINVKKIESDSRFVASDSEKDIIHSLCKYNDLEETIATQRYNFIEKVKSSCVIQNKVSTISQKLDSIFLNKILSFPIFIGLMFLIYYLSVGVVGSATVDMVGSCIDGLGEFVSNCFISWNVSEIITSLVVDGIIAGVGAVLGFVPQLIILFLCISLLETSGYMSRISLLLDKLFRKLGLSGKSLISFIVGSGCSVPGIMSTRTIENEDERKMTTILTPFIPCSAKLPIIALFAGYFFPNNSGVVSASLYFFAIAVIIISALIMKKFIFKNISDTYIVELPEYKIPNVKYVARDVFDKVIAFIKRAGTIILLCSIVIWFLLSFSFNFTYGVDIEDSILATIGNALSWIFYPMLGSKSWGATVSAIQGLVAKEQVVSSMAVINGLAADVEEGAAIFSTSGIFGFFSPVSAYAFMVFNLFSAPCFGAIGAMQRELGGGKQLLKAIGFQTIIAWLLGTLVFQIGTLCQTLNISVGSVIISILLIVIIIAVILNMQKKKNKCSGCPYCNSCKS